MAAIEFGLEEGSNHSVGKGGGGGGGGSWTSKKAPHSRRGLLAYLFSLFLSLSPSHVSLSEHLFPPAGDKHVVKLSLKSKESGHTFITTDFVFYNCSVLQS